MFFPSKKKRLWRACVTQFAGLNATTDAMCSQQQQQPHHQHQHHPPQFQQEMSTALNQCTSFPQIGCLGRCCCSINSENCSGTSHQTPFPPIHPSYSYLNSCCTEPHGGCTNMIIDLEIERQTDSKSDNTMVILEQEDNKANTVGCDSENYGDNSPGGNYNHRWKTASTRVITVSPTSMKKSRRTAVHQQCQRYRNISDIVIPPATTPNPIGMTMASAVAATAVNVFRNCCGGGCLSTASTDTNTIDGEKISQNHGSNTITTSSIPANNLPANTLVLVNSANRNSRNKNYGSREHLTKNGNDLTTAVLPTTISSHTVITTSCSCPSVSIPNPVNDPKDVFTALMKKLKDHQRATLLEAVENRFACSNNGRQPDCVLVQRGQIMGEEPNVIACRLWFWADLKDCSQLKRIPTCPNGKDRVYVCCNPTHWSRVLIPETAPPPYRRCAMDKLKPEDQNTCDTSKNLSITTTAITTSNNNDNNRTTGYICNSSEQQGLRVHIPDSFTTEGEDHSTWCQVLYWELAQRVGDRYLAKHSSINVYSEGPGWNNNSSYDGSSNNESRCGEMCLKDLAEKRKTAPPEIVQKIRRKIGLGITLCQEADGVWLYNRSAAPIFVSSPTLNDYDWWFHVSKVPPGYCLKAFDIYRVRTQPQQIASAQQGPIDKFCMRISFVKGWGPKYCRREIFTCPCWLEVIFTKR